MQPVLAGGREPTGPDRPDLQRRQPSPYRRDIRDRLLQRTDRLRDRKKCRRLTGRGGETVLPLARYGAIQTLTAPLYGLPTEPAPALEPAYSLRARPVTV